METFETHREVFPPPSSASTSCIEAMNGIPEFDIKGYSPGKGVEIGNYITSNTFAVACDACVIYFSPDGTDCSGRRTQDRLEVLDEILGKILDCWAVAVGIMLLMLLVLGRMNTFLDSSRELFHHIMVNIVLHHEGKLSFACGDYMGGQVTQLGELNSDFISMTHLHKLLREDLGYKNFEGLWCKFKGEPFERGVNYLESNADVIHILKLIEKDKLDTLHVYVEHSLDLLDIILADALQLLPCRKPSQQPTTTDLTVVEGGGQESEDEGGAQGRTEREGNGQERENERGREGDGNGQGREDEVKGDREQEDEDSDGSEDECLSNFFETDNDEPEIFGDFVTIDGEVVAGEGEDGAQGRKEREGNWQERENERRQECDGNGQEREGEVESDKEGEESDGEDDENGSSEDEDGDDNDSDRSEDEVGEDDDTDSSEDDDSDGREDERLSNFSETDNDEPEIFGDFVTIDGEVVAGEGEDGVQGRKEREGNWQERENERGRKGDGNGQGREGEVEGDKEGEESDDEDDENDGSEDEDGEDNDSDCSEDEVGVDDDSDSSKDDDNDSSKDEHLSNFSKSEVEGDSKWKECYGEDDDSGGSEDEHLSNFFEKDYNELGLFGDFVSVDEKVVKDEFSGLDGHVDEAFDHMDDQNNYVRTTATTCEDVNGQAHEVPMPQNPYKVAKQCYNLRCGRCGMVGHNAKSCRKPTNPNRPINPKKSSNEKNKDTQGNDAKAGPSTRNKSNAGTTKKKPSEKNKKDNPGNYAEVVPSTGNKSNAGTTKGKPSKKNKKENWGNDAKAGPSTRNKSNAGTTKKKPSEKNKKDNPVLVLCHNAISCHKLANPNPPTKPKKPSNKKNKETQGNYAEVVPSIGNKSNAGTTKRKPSKKNKKENCRNDAKNVPSTRNKSNPGTIKKKSSKKNKNDNQGGDIEAGPSIRSKLEVGATKKMLGKGLKQKEASNDIGGNENKDIVKHSEQNFKQWLHENSLFDHQRKNLNPQFLQILRDVLRHIGYLHQVENRCHGNLSELNILIVNGRGKITRMLEDVSKKYVNDYLSLVVIVRSCFCSQQQTIPTELELLLKYISKTKPNRLLNIEHHPIFLSPLQRLSYRVIAYTFLYFGEKKKSFQLKLNEKLPKYNWKLKVKTFRMMLNRNKSFKCLPEKQMKSLQYHKSATSFMRFGRNVVVHLADIDLGGKKLTAEEVDEELNGYWPKFMPILHQVLVDHGYLIFVHDAILK